MNKKCIRIYSDRDGLPDNIPHVPLLFPFWGIPDEKAMPLDYRIVNCAKSAFDHFLKEGKEWFKISPLSEADWAVLPIEWSRALPEADLKQWAMKFMDKAIKAGKKILVFWSHNSDDPFPIKEAIVFKSSIPRPHCNPNEYPYSFFSKDFVADYMDGVFKARPYSPKPTVGFCGLVRDYPKTFPYRFKYFLKKRGVFLNQTNGHFLRLISLNIFRGNPNINTNFKIYHDFYAGVFNDMDSIDLGYAKKIQDEYAENLINSDYVLCTRGVRNFSYRLFEILSCGRIPIFVDTGQLFPYEEFIEYEKLFVRINWKDIPRIGDLLLKFHRSLTPAEYVKRQEQCRRVWEEWLSPYGFFANFYRIFEKIRVGS
ncbi:MAG: exostosin family protein [Candidatus Omnitrophica bacterium]|nr:exostosin family protein [Candidatus Omnitrophota bacterium]